MFNSRYSVLILLGIGIDQTTKYFSEKYLSFFTPNIIIESIISFQLVHNYGAAYGILQNQKILLLCVSLFIIIGSYIFRNSIAKTKYSKMGLSFLMIGAIGNSIDRVVNGYVIDFINIYIIPVFNIADICINIAILCFVYESYKLYKNDIKESN